MERAEKPGDIDKVVALIKAAGIFNIAALGNVSKEEGTFSICRAEVRRACSTFSDVFFN